MQVNKRVFHRFFTHFSIVGYFALCLVLVGECSSAVSTPVVTSEADSGLTTQLAPASVIVSTPIVTIEMSQQILRESPEMSPSISPHSSSAYFVPETSLSITLSSIQATQTSSSSSFDIHSVEPSPTSHSRELFSSLQERSLSSDQPPQSTAWTQVEGASQAVGAGQPAQLSHEAMTWVTSQPSSAQQLHGEYAHALPAGTVAGIVIASLGFLGVLGAALGFLALKRFRPLSAKNYDNSYSSGDTFSYLDNLQVSYINHHVQLPKDSSDEMFSLDNDSFLNSLEAMTMENYWAEESKNTKV